MTMTEGSRSAVRFARPRADPPSELRHDFECSRITRCSGLGDMFAADGFGVAACKGHDRCEPARCCGLPREPCKTASRGVTLPAPAPATGAERSGGIHDHVAGFAGVSVRAAEHRATRR